MIDTLLDYYELVLFLALFVYPICVGIASLLSNEPSAPDPHDFREEDW